MYRYGQQQLHVQNVLRYVLITVMMATYVQMIHATFSLDAGIQTIIIFAMMEMSVLHWTSAATVYAHPAFQFPVMTAIYAQMMPATLSMDARIQTIIIFAMMEMSVLQWTSAAAVYARPALLISVMTAIYAQMMPATLSMDARIQTIITPVMMEILQHSMIHALAEFAPAAW